MTLARMLRDRRHRRDVKRWAKRNSYPAMVERKYWSTAEFEEDAARLKAHGYVVTGEQDTNPYVDVATAPNFYGKDPRSVLVVTIPMFRVTYERSGPL
jgi:hypothetical protein